jgi:carboxypeptidase T
MHAREYATAELATRFAEQLISDYGLDADTTWLLDHYRVHIIPQLNPDGRKIAEQQSTRFKRKNHNLDFCSTEVPVANGIDLNRNSSVLWGVGSGSSGNACNPVYRGPRSSSEPETEAIEAYLDNVFPDARPGNPNDLNQPAPAETPGLFISLHSFGELLLFPWEAVASNSGNHAGLRSLARKLAFFNDYWPCQDCLGTAAGTTVDYAYGARGVAAYTFEIGTDFFQSCGVFENTVLPDNLAALKFALKAARRPYLEPAGPEMIGLDTQMTANGLMVAAVADDRRRSTITGDGEPADGAQPVTLVQLSLNIPPFSASQLLPMSASDGSFNSNVEMVELLLPLGELNAGHNSIYLTATDTSGQSGVPSATFVNLETFSVDGFE